jgi:hypothetical protein
VLVTIELNGLVGVLMTHHLFRARSHWSDLHVHEFDEEEINRQGVRLREFFFVERASNEFHRGGNRNFVTP